VLDVRALTKAFGSRLAVDGLTFTARPGEILGVVGPNGAGKTTTMRMIAGITAPSGGTVRVAGHAMAADPVEAKRRLAIVPDEPALFAQLTVWEHVEFTARVYGVDGWQARAEALLGELELADRSRSLADELSRGMRQKVALACALLHRPALLMLDEPLTGLDPRGIRTLYSLLRRLADEGSAVMLSSHLLGQIEGLCTDLLIMRQGKGLFHGTTGELRARFPALGPDASLEDLFFEAVEGSEAPGALP
jgi:ABC-2 type transport system ATP-binding protein